MNVLLYFIIFIIGILFGSFYTLAIHRIPKKQNITYKYSYCPNCHKKLGVFELVPVFSYIFLGGKCKHCGEKIEKKYLIIELLSGIVFVLLAMALGLNIYNITINNLIFFAFSILYISTLFLIGGIDREKRKIEKGVLYFGVVVSIIYMIYLYIIGSYSSIYTIYIMLLLIALFIDNYFLKRYLKNNYVIGVVILLLNMVVITGELVTISTIIITLFAIGFYMIIYKLKNLKIKDIKNKKVVNRFVCKNISIGYFLSSVNIIMFIIVLSLSTKAII